MTDYNQVNGPSVGVEPIGKNKITPDTPLRFDGGTFFDSSDPVYLFRRKTQVPTGPDDLEFVKTLGGVNRTTNWRAGPPGWYEIHKSKDPVLGSGPGYERPETGITSYEVKPGPSGASIDADESGFVAAGPKTDGPEPEDYPGVVNADNSAGAALAPALRRRGVEIDDVGTTATIGGETVEITAPGEATVAGETIPVGDITEADEVARNTTTGGVVPTDADVAGAGGGDLRSILSAAAVVAAGLIAAAVAAFGGD
jgi:hypothetical protein